MKYTASGIPVGRFSLATNERCKDKSGKFQDRTEWHNVVVWRKLAEIVGEFVSKGSHLYVEGKLETTSWEDRLNREKKYRTEIVATDLVLLGLREKGNGAQQAGSDNAGKAKPTAPAAGIPEISDDDLPFLTLLFETLCSLRLHDDSRAQPIRGRRSACIAVVGGLKIQPSFKSPHPSPASQAMEYPNDRPKTAVRTALRSIRPANWQRRP